MTSNKIQVLDKNISRLIAAGEVIERPASVVKELVENAIDAGSRIIQVEIKNGGISYIKVFDDGFGIERESIQVACLRHATSKISSEADLDGIATLGFRGEALASIAAVSKLSIITRTKDEIAGTKYTLEGAEKAHLEDEGCAQGTTVIVEDLFFNLPARMKFLKRDALEAAAVNSLVEKLALSHPEISFKFIKDGEIRLHTPGDGKLLSAIYEVMGKDIAKEMIPIDYESETLKLSGYIVHPSKARASRSYENFFVNGRYVKTKTMIAALEGGYKNQMTQGRYPACVLSLTVPYFLVDVNVHPAKIEVKFANEKDIYNLICAGVSLALKNALQPVIVRDRNEIFKNCDPQKPEFKAPSMVELKEYREVGFFEGAPKLQEKLDQVLKLHDQQSEKKPQMAKEACDHNYNEDLMKDETDANVKQDVLGELVFLGEILKTYIVCEASGKLVLIDKHAAHENLLFEQIKQRSKQSVAQLLLEPVILDVSKLEYECVLEHRGTFMELGFEIDNLGEGCVIVRGVPFDLLEKDVELLIADIIAKLRYSKRDLSLNEKDQMLYSIACKAAIKAHDKNNTEELQHLVSILNQKKGLLCCPHGRPVCCVIERKEIEKWFART